MAKLDKPAIDSWQLVVDYFFYFYDKFPNKLGIRQNDFFGEIE